ISSCSITAIRHIHRSHLNKSSFCATGILVSGLMTYVAERFMTYDFEMKYYNSDGNESTLCGNGGRCITAFAKRLGLITKSAEFVAIDGPHKSLIDDDNVVELHMNEVNSMIVKETYFQLNTGSPHYVHYIDDVKDLNVKKEGALIRYSPLYKDEGINVNFVEVMNNREIFVRTYERGVEDETLSCGTGVTASALTFIKDETGEQIVTVHTLGGILNVRCNNINGQQFDSIWLCGKADFVFEGDVSI
ncbi:diaminopimelate epimerase, partial [Filimonas sp.]